MFDFVKTSFVRSTSRTGYSAPGRRRMSHIARSTSTLRHVIFGAGRVIRYHGNDSHVGARMKHHQSFFPSPTDNGSTSHSRPRSLQCFLQWRRLSDPKPAWWPECWLKASYGERIAPQLDRVMLHPTISTFRVREFSDGYELHSIKLPSTPILSTMIHLANGTIRSAAPTSEARGWSENGKVLSITAPFISPHLLVSDQNRQEDLH